MSASTNHQSPQLSVVVPVHNEEDNVAPMVGEIVAALRKLLPPQAVPERIHGVESMPRTPTGKVDGKALKARLTQEDGWNER